MMTSLIAACSFSSQASAEDSLDDLLALDIESLASIEVSVASKKSEKISEAPGIISVVTSEDIHKFGGQTLHDILDRMPGVYTYGQYIFPENTVSIRGGAQDGAINKRVLILLNGRPMRDPLRGGVNSTIYRSFPVDAIERIEMIRGPGSVLYGSSAFSGVINIITKTGDTLGANSASVSYGSFSTKQAALTAGENFEDHEFQIFGSTQITRSTGWLYDYTGVNGFSDNPDRGEEHHGSFVEAQYRRLKMSVFNGYENVQTMTNASILPLANNYKVLRRFADIGYTQPLWADWEASLNATYNNFYNFHNTSGTTKEKGTSYLFEVSASGSIFDDVNLLVGAVSDNYDVRLNPTTTNSNTWYSGYIQADYKPVDWMKLVGGLQLNKPNGIEKDFSPRAGIILTPIEHWGLKLLYGEAFRSPYSNETALDLPVIVGNPNLVPEKIRTLDAQIFYEDAKYNASLTAYKSIQNDSIIVDTSVAPSIFMNGGTVTYKGLEFEGEARLTDEWDVQGSLTWQTGEDWLGHNQTTYSPHYMAKIGISYTPRDSFYTLGVHNSYYSSNTKVEELIPTAAVTNPSPDSYNWLSANVNIDLPKALSYSNGPDMTFSLYGENLLDEEVYDPNGGVARFNSAPGRAGRGVYARLTVRF